MGRTTVSRVIHAPLEKVFDTVAHIDNFSKVVPEIVRVEFVSENRSGVGARFRETRRMGKREMTVELEVKEYVENDRIRIVSDTAGTVWDSLFTVKPAAESATELTLTMDAKAHEFLPKLVNPLFKGLIRKGIEKDMDAVKAHCEQGAGG